MTGDWGYAVMPSPSATPLRGHSHAAPASGRQHAAADLEAGG